MVNVWCVLTSCAPPHGWILILLIPSKPINCLATHELAICYCKFLYMFIQRKISETPISAIMLLHPWEAVLEQPRNFGLPGWHFASWATGRVEPGLGRIHLESLGHGDVTLRACLKLQESQEVALQHLLYTFITIIYIYIFTVYIYICMYVCVCVCVCYIILYYIYIYMSQYQEPILSDINKHGTLRCLLHSFLPPNLGDKMPYILINLHTVNPPVTHESLGCSQILIIQYHITLYNII